MPEFAIRSNFHPLERETEYAGKGKALHPSGQDSQVLKAIDAWRFANVVERNRRILRDRVLIAGLDEHHREGSYYLEWYEHGKRYRKAVADFATVTEAARLKAIEVEALKAGVMSRPAQRATIKTSGVTLTAAVDRYLAMVEAQRSHRTYTSYRYTLKKLLVPSYEQESVDQVAREDILAFMTRALRTGTWPPYRLRQTGRRAAAFRTGKAG